MSTPSSECPRMHSLPFYTSVKFGRSCRRLTQEDVGNMKAFLRRCYPYYTKKTLKDDCITNTCQAPPECVEHNAAYKIFYYLTDIGFICNGTETCDRLTYTTLFYNFKPEPVLEYYTKTFQGKDLSNDYVRVTAVYQSESLKDKLFPTYLIGDLKYFAVALGMILLILIVYMRSVVLVIALMGNVAASFVAAYAVYFYVFRIEFFPFINIISGLILIAIGADNVFVFYDAWKEAKKSDRNIPLENQVSRTFSHAAVAITVTSLTTSASFYANCVTHIPAIRCFGIFAGTAILANYIFMMTWTPAVVVMVEILDRMCLSRCSCWEKSNKFLGRVADVVCSKGVSVLIEKLWPLWLLLFMSLGVAGLIVVFISPGLRLPTSREFQLYPTSQPLEYWDQVVRKRFQFYLDHISGDQDEVPLNYIWGMVPVDNRKWDNTSDMGYLVEDASFDIFSHEAQLWLKGFARQATNQSSVRGFHGQKVLSTFEALETVLTDHCGGSTQLDKTLSRYITACCHNRSMPFSRQYLEVCFAPVYMATLMAIEPNRVIGKPLFNKSNALKALIIELPTNSHYSTSYEEMDTMYSLRETFFTSQLSTAPKGLQNGFMSGYGWFNFYDLQRAISHGTYYSIVLSLGVATILMLLTSLNLLVTLYAMVTITFAIAVTIGVLVLLGWHLNIIESITISLAVGLSIDFTIHYGVTYRLSKEQQPFLRVREGFARVGSAVAMAALTTFVAGAAVMPAHILAYSKLGMFLMLVMSISWAYATFFFQSLCRIIGPRGKFCQIPLRCGKKKVEVDSDLQLPNQVLYRQREVEPFSFNNVMDPIDDDDNLLHPFWWIKNILDLFKYMHKRRRKYKRSILPWHTWYISRSIM